jgi:predicted Zn-dependent protease
MKTSTRWTLAVLLIVPIACSTNPYTGRKQLMLLDRESELQLGAQAYQEALAAEPRLTKDPIYFNTVSRVAKRLATEIEKGWEGIEPPGYEWDVQVIDNPKVANAWCLPGGKIAVYTGIFPMCGDENGLAVVMGHEMMHAVLRHGNERVSQGMLGEIGTSVLATVIGGENAQKKQMAHGLIGLGLAVGVLLPYSRENETEADEFGLLLAARAGYDPRRAVELWTRMGQSSGDGPPEFLSTHPDPGTRVKNMEKWMPSAMAAYEKSARHKSEPLAEPGRARIDPRRPTSEEVLALEGSKRGASGAEFALKPRRDVFLKRVSVEGPDGRTAAVNANAGLPGGRRRVLALTNAAPGKYEFTLEGAVDGRPWSQKVVATVK